MDGRTEVRWEEWKKELRIKEKKWNNERKDDCRIEHTNNDDYGIQLRKISKVYIYIRVEGSIDVGKEKWQKERKFNNGANSFFFFKKVMLIKADNWKKKSRFFFGKNVVRCPYGWVRVKNSDEDNNDDYEDDDYVGADGGGGVIHCWYTGLGIPEVKRGRMSRKCLVLLPSTGGETERGGRSRRRDGRQRKRGEGGWGVGHGKFN